MCRPQTLTQLRALSLENVGMSDRSAVPLTKALFAVKTLQVLVMRRSTMTVRGANAMSVVIGGERPVKARMRRAASKESKPSTPAGPTPEQEKQLASLDELRVHTLTKLGTPSFPVAFM
jgi:hypothetical protein